MKNVGLIASIGWALVGVAALLATLAGGAGWLGSALLPDPALLSGAPALIMGCPPLVLLAIAALPSAVRLHRGDPSGAGWLRTTAILGFFAAFWMNAWLTWASFAATDTHWVVHIGLLGCNMLMAALPCGWLWTRAGAFVATD